MKKNILFAVFFLCILFVSCCDGDEVLVSHGSGSECLPANINREAYKYMQNWYLWYEHLPKIDPADYETISDMLKDVKYREGDTLIDRFSYAVTKEEHDSYYAGKHYGMGLSWKRDEEDSLYISMVYPGSPAGKAGLRRGQKVLALNDVTVETLDENATYNREHREDPDFEEKTDWDNVYNSENKGEAVKFLVSENGEELETTVYLDDYTSPSVLASEIIENEEGKIGYVHLKSFIQSSDKELDEVFAGFKKENVDRLILDLRYNGGGLVKIAEHLVDLILGEKVRKQEIIKIVYNDKHQDQNYSYEGKALKNSLKDVKHVAVIVTSGTASASEMVINSLRPFVEVTLFGKTTYGKPVGMNSKDICDQTIVPITFKYTNSENYGDFFLGMEADCNSEDDFKHDFGDVQEDGVKNALYYFENGKCLENPALRILQRRRNIEDLIPGKLKGMGRIDYTF